jgi:hypothetical protein
VDKDLSSQLGILWGLAFSFDCSGNLVVLSARYQPIAKTPLSMLLVGITETERKIELAPGVLDANIEVAFRSPSVSLPYLVFNRTQPESDAVGSDYSVR